MCLVIKERTFGLYPGIRIRAKLLEQNKFKFSQEERYKYGRVNKALGRTLIFTGKMGVTFVLHVFILSAL